MDASQSPILWRHPAPENTALVRFAREVSRDMKTDLSSYEALHHWSVTEPGAFWRRWLAWSGIAYAGSPDPPHDGGSFPDRRWFPGVELSVAGNLLRPAVDSGSAEREALVAIDESGRTRRLSYRILAAAVLRVRKHLSPLVGPGDRVAAVLPNGLEAVVAMLAVTSLGAVWSSASPDFGVAAIVDRFGQIEPTVFIGCTGYRYGATDYPVGDRMSAVRAQIPSIRAAFAIPTLSGQPLPEGFAAFPDIADAPAIAPVALADALAMLPRFPFDHPMYIMFSSGTTGTPKCIVHGAGGTLLQHAKEHILHSDLHAGDRILYFTTCGWMMWNWLVSALFVGATVYLYDGSPASPSIDHLWDITAAEGLTHLGASPRFLAACRNAEVDARDRTASLRVLFSTGAPLLPEDFDYVYQRVAPQAQLASISGGTDIISCFMLGVPTLPVRRGEIQAAGLGMDIIAAHEDGTPLIGSRGELVCRTPFPSRPLGFHGDRDGSRYRAAYFERFPGWWTHGDFIAITGSVGGIGGIVVYGRSDATLNPGGVRIGTAEIYRQVETMEGILDSLVVGRPLDGDVEVTLFVVCTSTTRCDDDLRERIRRRIRENASPRHVPRRIYPVPAIPYTRSGKKVELAVRDILDGREPANVDALANPDALEAFRAVYRTLSAETAPATRAARSPSHGSSVTSEPSDERER